MNRWVLCGILSGFISIQATASDIPDFDEVAFDFIKNAPSAHWHNPSCSVSFGNNDSKGSILYTDRHLEDGSFATNILFSHPSWEANGFMHGGYEMPALPAGDYFFAVEYGFAEGANCTTGARFSAYTYDGNQWQAVMPYTYKNYDGNIVSQTYDYPSSMLNKSHSFFLNTDAGASSSCDWTLWKRAQLMHSPPVNVAHFCRVEGYEGWGCLNFERVHPDTSVPYYIQVRWNMTTQPPNGTALFVLGGNGRGYWRDYDDHNIRTRIKNEGGVRSVEIEFKNLHESVGGYFAADVNYPEDTSLPQSLRPSGYRGSAGLYTQIVKDLKSMDIIQGDVVVQVAGSNGTTLAAQAMSYYNFDAEIDRAVFVSGPFFSNLNEECSDTTARSYITDTGIRAAVDLWNGWQDGKQDFCKKQKYSPLLDERSTLGSKARRNYRNIDVYTLMGAREVVPGEGIGQWILDSNDVWYQRIRARHKSREVFPNIGHGGFSDPDLADRVVNLILQAR